MRRILLSVLVAFALLMVSGYNAVEAKDSVELGLHLSEGLTYTQREITKIATDQDILGESVHSIVTTSYEYTNEVLRVDRFGAADVLITYKSIYYKQEGPSGIEEYNSENAQGEVPDSAKGYAALIGGQFTVRYSPKGEILAVEGIQDLIDQIINQYEFEDESMLQIFKERIESICNEETIKESMSLPTGVYPKEAVQIGEGWKESKIISTGFPIKTESAWKLKKILDGLAYIDVETKVLPNADAEPLTIDSMTLSYDLSGIMTGSMEVYEEIGLIKQANLKMKLSGDIKIDGVPGFSEGIISHITVDGSTHMETIDMAVPAEG